MDLALPGAHQALWSLLRSRQSLLHTAGRDEELAVDLWPGLCSGAASQGLPVLLISRAKGKGAGLSKEVSVRGTLATSGLLVSSIGMEPRTIRRVNLG